MSFLRKLVCFILLHLVTTRPQINLDLTNLVSNSDNNVTVQHDCLHVAAMTKSETDTRQIISYCMSEWPSEWTIQEYSLNQKLTFAALAELGITTEQLYIWSAPMDVIENYQYYLNQLSISKDVLSMTTQFFYNCTSPTFGPLCQYSLDGYESSDSSLEDIIYDFYSYSYSPTTLMCYTHLNCNNGTSLACLEWHNICDGQIDCFDDGLDEKDCWQLQINECKDNEYRCKDGQCIPKTFLVEDQFSVDCIDGPGINPATLSHPDRDTKEPVFATEDRRCIKNPRSAIPFISSCDTERGRLILKAMFFDIPNSIPDDCWFAFRCYFKIPDSSHPRCNDICANETCQSIINRTCPDILYIPNTPILFGHIYLAYTKVAVIESKNRILRPTYICYNEQLCGGFLSNKTLLLLNNATCRQPQDFPLQFYPVAGGRISWIETYILPIYKHLYKCNTIPQHIVTVCNTSLMYQCVNSSKCITKDRVDDMLRDCDYDDDEQQDVINRVCLNDRSKTFFKCKTTMNKCIHRERLGDGYCDCGQNEYDLCDDEDLQVHRITTHISFPSMCDGFTELSPIMINGQNETDETECELWHCNNTYTRCDGFWNCIDGADEIDCNSSSLSSLLNCSSQHICISPNTSQLMCLSLMNVNDGNIDCLGATDEPDLCRSNSLIHNEIQFYCQTHSYPPCTWSRYLCDDIYECIRDYNTEYCFKNQNITVPAFICHEDYETIRSDVEKFVCARRSQRFKQLDDQFFSLGGDKQPKRIITPTSTLPPLINNYNDQSCHRGFPLRVWLDRNQNLTNLTCLCPPSFYGDVCQYQNQRVSLSVKFLAYSDSRRTLFAIVISLIDDSDERTIHSHHQLTYLYIRDCEMKFNIYLLYSTRLKNQTKKYSLRIDIYEKLSLKHRGSLLVPLKFLFLPVQRVAAQLNIPPADELSESCSNQPCLHGRCMTYSNNSESTTFCYCEEGWSGRYCNIPFNCSCSSDSLCIGISSNNQSICVCPMTKFGSRCLLSNHICQSDSNRTCDNGGKCIPADEYMATDNKFFCICPKSYIGDRCEKPNIKILVSFHKNIQLPQSMMVHFIRVLDDNFPSNGSTIATISNNNRSAIIYWSHPFHIAFIKLSEMNYYLIIVQKTYNASITTFPTINPSDRCAHISEVLNTSITQLDLIRRIKYYHLPCQNRSTHLSCFYDDTHFCLCTDFGLQRLANCFEFNHTNKFDCFGRSNCENGAECLQDRSTCPLASLCMCPTCFYGLRCQFSSNGFGLSLDGILGYHIQPHINITHQPFIVQLSIVLTIIMTIVGFIDGVLSTITFQSKDLHKVGCGLYLLGSSITTLFLSVMFALKFGILIIAQMNYITTRSFLKVQCISVDYLLRVGLHMDQWLNACVAIERAITTMKGISFHQMKSKQMAQYVIPILLFLTMSTNIYDPFHRSLIDEGDDGEEKRIWCAVTYSSAFHILNSSMNILHFFAPFIINIVSAIIIIAATTRKRRAIHKHANYRNLLFGQIRQHKNLLIAPFVLVILAIPRLVLSFVSGCMNSTDDSWLFLVGYFISFIPSMLTFVVFVLPSKSYTEKFWTNIRQYRSKIRTRLGLVS